MPSYFLASPYNLMDVTNLELFYYPDISSFIDVTYDAGLDSFTASGVAMELQDNTGTTYQMFEDDSIIVTDEKDRVLKPQPAVDLPGPLNTYPQIVLFNKNPICAVINGRMH